MPEIEALAATLLTVAVPGMKPKALIAAVREHYPQVSKKEIVRAAFYSLTESTPSGSEKAAQLQDFAIGERTSADDEVDPVPKRKRTPKPKKKKSKSSEHGAEISN